MRPGFLVVTGQEFCTTEKKNNNNNNRKIELDFKKTQKATRLGMQPRPSGYMNPEPRAGWKSKKPDYLRQLIYHHLKFSKPTRSSKLRYNIHSEIFNFKYN